MRKKVTFIIIGISVVIIVAFFMPWVRGKASILKPLDDSTKGMQEVDSTGVTKGVIKTTKNIADTFTQIVTGKKLKVALRGFRIPIHVAKEEGLIVYLLYLVPIAAIICGWFSVLGNRKRYFDAIVVLVAFSLFVVLYQQGRSFNQEKLFIDIKECWGFRITLYSFLTLGILALMKFLSSKKETVCRR